MNESQTQQLLLTLQRLTVATERLANAMEAMNQANMMKQPQRKSAAAAAFELDSDIIK